MDVSNLTFIDVETTGLSPVRDRIIEIGLLRMKNGRVTKTYSTLVNPGSYIPPEITMLTGITSDQLEQAPTFSRVAPEIADLLEGSLFVAHNARFDYSFIRAEFARLDRSFTSRILCTAKLSRRLYPRYRRHNLDSLIDRFGIACDARHRAFSDAKALSDFWRIVRKQFSAAKLSDAVSTVTKSASLPGAIPAGVIHNLPESPGVYIFYGKDGAPLYIGKSINIKDRVRSHFYDYARSNKEARIFGAIESIESVPTSGELGALLLESRMIKDLQPVYNRQLRTSNSLIALFPQTTPDGYHTVSQRELSDISLEEIERILAVFRTKNQMKNALIEMARAHTLCQKLLGLEKSTGRCFGSQINTCNGACLGNELPARYNMRFTEAFHQTRIRQWPFPGPIAIREGNRAHVVYKWCYLGDAETLSGDIADTAAFDYDSYKILSSHLLKKSRDPDIRQLAYAPSDHTALETDTSHEIPR